MGFIFIYEYIHAQTHEGALKRKNSVANASSYRYPGHGTDNDIIVAAAMAYVNAVNAYIAATANRSNKKSVVQAVGEGI